MHYDVVKRFFERCPSRRSRCELLPILKDDVVSVFSLCHFFYEKFGDGKFKGKISAGLYLCIFDDDTTIPGYTFDAFITLSDGGFIQLYKID